MGLLEGIQTMCGGVPVPPDGGESDDGEGVPLSPVTPLSAGEGLNLLEQSSDLVCVCRDGRISYINSAGSLLLEADDPETLAGLDFYQFIAPEYSGALEGFLDVLSGETEPFPTKMIGLGGARIDAEISVVRIGEAGDGGLAIIVHDITNRIRLSEAIQRSEARFRRLVNNARNLFCVCDEDAVAFINPAGIELLGAGNSDRIVGRPFADFVHGDYRHIFSGGIADDIREQSLLWLKLVGLDGEVRDVEATILPVDRRIANRYMVEARDITQHNRAVAALHQTNVNLDQLVKERTRALTEEVAVRKRAEEMLRHSATHDGLTGLPNRGLLMDRLAAALSRARRERSNAAVLFLDLDGFKAVNDSLGHDVGDILLKDVARTLKGCIRETDTVARLGGDEFIFVLADVADADAVAKVARKIIEALSEPVVIDGVGALVGGSIGIALYPEHAKTPGALIAEADSAMYVVKETGRNNFRFASH